MLTQWVTRPERPRGEKDKVKTQGVSKLTGSSNEWMLGGMNASTSKNWPPDGAAKQSVEYKQNCVNFVEYFHKNIF